MSIILNIDTAIQSASVCLAKNENIIGIKINPSQKDSASWLHVSIKELLEEKEITLSQINAIAISAGPGSYTGLRVGMAAAKGFCYALQIPLITINTLQMMAVAAQQETTELLCAMIDARRMEVFTALFDKNLNEVSPYTNLVLDKNSFKNILNQHTITFFGNGSDKFKPLISHPNASFKNIEAGALQMVPLSYQKCLVEDFSSLAYTVPFYGKDFHSTSPKSS